MPLISRLRPLISVGGLSLAGSLPVITLQLMALLVLGLVDYGLFSLLYLGFAWMSSLAISVICEPWAHARRHKTGAPTSWDDFGTVSLCLSLVAGVIGIATGWGLHGLPLGLATGLALILSTARLASRYHWLSVGQRTRQSWADVLSAVILVVAGIAFPVTTPEALMTVWAASNVLPLVMNRPPHWRSPVTWWSGHRRRIVALVTDSSLMDITTIGVPLFLAPVMGMAGFGIYRAVGNAALPVRLVMTSVRPLLGTLSLAASTSKAIVVGLGAAALLTGGGVVGALMLVPSVEALDQSVLGSLGQHLVPVGVFVSSNFMAMYLQLLMRVHSTARQILANRLIQMVISGGGPLAGWAIGGIHGAIWGLALSECVQTLILTVWIVRRRRSAKRIV